MHADSEEVLIEIIKYPMSGLHKLSLLQFSAFLTDSTHITINCNIGSSGPYDVFHSASTTEITKPD